MYHNYKSVERVKPGGLELKDSLVGVQRVTKVTKGGRTFGFSAIVVVGDENGVVGHGLGKSKDVSSAIAKAVDNHLMYTVVAKLSSVFGWGDGVYANATMNVEVGEALTPDS